MKKLIYANNRALLPELLDEQKERYRRLVLLADYHFLLTRSLPFPRHADTEFSKAVIHIPSDPYTTPVSFSEATNLRAAEIAAIAETNDLPIVVMWSGGIDSTVVLSAVLQNFSKALLDRVQVRMSNASYIENSEFYRNIIVKNKISHHSGLHYDYNNAMILHGDPADALWLGGNILTMAATYANSHNLNFHKGKGKDFMLDHLTHSSNKEYALWLYQMVVADSTAAGVEVNTIADFFWWLIFNHNMTPMCLKHLGEVVDQPNNINLLKYKQHFFNWYNTDTYQKWSMQAQVNCTKFDGTTRSYKMEAKQYIYEYDKNQWYRDYKTKVHSQYMSESDEHLISAIYDDGEVVINNNIIISA